VWLKPLRVTLTLPGVDGIFPDIPDTVMFDGYGFAVLLSTIVIGFELVKTV
jgi:hypothetical protein